MDAVQKLFIGGINQLAADHNLAPDEYVWLVNGRSRFGVIEPINKHVLQEGLPEGTMQGGIGVGNVAVVFVDGKAYYREDGDTFWTLIGGFQMSTTAPHFWAVSVPASTMNFIRKPDATSIKSPISLTADFKVAGTPAGILVQDGENQPWIIEFDFISGIYISRVTKTFAEWQNNGTSREYVPIGKQMMLINQTLFIVARDGKSVYRSVTGRPLDFMVNVKPDGNKQPTEGLGGAATVSFAMDFDEITCLKPLNIPDSFIYGTARNSRIVTLDYLNTIFGEPTFRTTAIISAGIVNQDSFVELIGDYAFIDFDAVKSFDAVQLLRYKGRNSIFSLEISRMLFNKARNAPIKQRNCSCITYDNYALFNVDTNFGNIIAVYDMITEKWVSFDITAVFKVKQFFIVEAATKSKLYAITVRDELYEMFALSTEREIPIMRTKAFSVERTTYEHKSEIFRPQFADATYDGVVTLLELVDEQLSPANSRITKDIPARLGGVPYPVIPPVFPQNESKIDVPAFQLKDGLTGKHISFIITWNNDAVLEEYEIKTGELGGETSTKETNQVYADKYGE